MLHSRFLDIQIVRNGRGIVALKPFVAGEVVTEITGSILTSDQVWNLWSSNPDAAANCFRFCDDRYLNPQNELGAFANHSCNPNAWISKSREQLFLRARRTIVANEEVVHDYSTLLGSDDIWRMECNCGEANCRGVVERFDRLPSAVRRHYLATGAIPSYILQTNRSRAGSVAGSKQSTRGARERVSSRP